MTKRYKEPVYPPCRTCGGRHEAETWQEVARAVARCQRRAQGLPEHIEDPAVIERLAALLVPRLGRKAD